MQLTPLRSKDYHTTLAGHPALVLFTAPGCGACRRLRGILPELAEEAGLSLYEVDASREGALVHALEIFHLPAVFLYQDGGYHAAIHAEATASALRLALARARAAPAEEEP